MAWYERKEISLEEGYNYAMGQFADDEHIPEWIVKQYLKEAQSVYNSLGSYRGFATFELPMILKKSRRRNRDMINAMETLKRATPLKVWMNNILYRPPDKTHKTLRYNQIKQSFNRYQSPELSDTVACNIK